MEFSVGAELNRSSFALAPSYLRLVLDLFGIYDKERTEGQDSKNNARRIQRGH